MEAPKSWKVVGGTETEGILVRQGKHLSSPLERRRLATGSIVRETALVDGRLQYIMLKGSGPSTGWVSVKLKTKDLLIPAQSSASDKLQMGSVSGRLDADKSIATFAMG